MEGHKGRRGGGAALAVEPAGAERRCGAEARGILLVVLVFPSVLISTERGGAQKERPKAVAAMMGKAVCLRMPVTTSAASGTSTAWQCTAGRGITSGQK